MLRRDFILSSALFGLTHKVGATPIASNAVANGELLDNSVCFVSAIKTPLGEHFFVCLNDQFEIVAEHLIPRRGHSVAYSSLGHIAAVGRRPADFCLVLDVKGNKLAELNSQAGRHFYGHGVYSPDGLTLYLTENNYEVEKTQGVVGIYSVQQNYERVGEFSTHGIGPHEILLSPDGTQLIVANGGIQTHPETGRKKLNVDSMQPSLVYLDRLTGELVNQAKLDDGYRYNSIRHLSLGHDGYVYIALQQQNKDTTPACLLARFDPQKQKLEKIDIQPELESSFNGYVGDICVDHFGRYIAATSPKGDVVLLIDQQTNDVRKIHLDDVCGLTKPYSADDSAQFVVSTGQGKITLITLSEGAITQSAVHDTAGAAYWDNHIRRISLI